MFMDGRLEMDILPDGWMGGVLEEEEVKKVPSGWRRKSVVLPGGWIGRRIQYLCDFGDIN